MTSSNQPFFVSDGDDRVQTATLLVGTADEHGIPQDDIHATTGGFLVSSDLADLVRDHADVQPVDEADPYAAAASDAQAAADNAYRNAPDAAVPSAEAAASGDEDDEDIEDEDDEDIEDEDDEEGFDPSATGVEGVKAFVNEHPETAADVLAAEREGENRSSLVNWLTKKVESQNDPS